MEKTLLADYWNGNYQVTLLEDGTKIRKTEEDFFVPAFPENLDVKITNKCDGGCPFCYEHCTPEGKHAELFDSEGKPLQEWLKSLHPGTEIAVNGNDLSHPQLDTLLQFLKEQGVITNMTVNQKHFMKYEERLKKWSSDKLIWGLGISLVDPCRDFVEKVVAFPNAVLHTIVGLLTLEDIKKLREYGNNLKILLLGYKTKGRGVDFRSRFDAKITENTKTLRNSLKFMKYWFKAVSFDCLALEQLDVKNTLFKGREEDWKNLYQGSDGTTTLYVDAVARLFAKDSSVLQNVYILWDNMTVDEMLVQIHRDYETEKF